MLNKNLFKKIFSITATIAVTAVSFLSLVSTPAFATNPKLTVSNTVDKQSADRGETLSYTLVVTDAGNTDLTNIVVWTNPLNLATWVNGSGTYTRNGVTKPLADDFITAGGKFATATPLKSGEAIIFKFQTKVAQNANNDDILWLIGNAKSEQTPNTVTSNSWTRVIFKNPGICAEKTADKTSVSVGDVVTFTIKVCNNGNIVLNNVRIGDIIHSPLQYIPGSTTSQIENQVTVVADSWLQDGFNADYLNPGQETFLKFKVKVLDSLTDGQVIQNVAQVKSDETPNILQCAVTLKGKVLAAVITPTPTPLPVTPTELPNTGPGELLLLGSLVAPAGWLIKKFKSKI